MDMIIEFPGDLRVDARLGERTISTDQVNPTSANGSGPPPFTLFLASIGTCAGIYVLSFCRQRNIPTDGVRIVQRTARNSQNHMIESIDLEIQVPPDFPAKYYDALVRAADQCAVKKHLINPPAFNVYTQVTDG
jgi:ribosomal protein S12 methylthiotransferase accessory factor